LAASNGALPIINTVYLNDRTPRRGFTYRNFDLDVFGIKGPRTFLSKISENLPIPGAWLAVDMLSQRWQGLFDVVTVTDSNWSKYFLDRGKQGKDNGWGSSFTPHSANRMPKALFFDDYFQSHKYFEGAEDIVRHAFQFSREPEPEVSEILSQVRNCPSVSVNVRGGDYLNPQNSQIFTTLGSSYYQKAVERILDKEPGAQFFVTTNDLARAKEVLSFIPSVKLHFVPDSVSGWKNTGHLRIMSACQHRIIANSTFGWWGAWLSTTHGLTIAPKNWFVEEDRNTEDLTPNHWLRI